MPSFRKSIVTVAAGLMILACKESPDPPRLPPRASSIPERSSIPHKKPRTDKTLAPSVLSNRADELVKGPRIKRFTTPGAVRWTSDLGKPITFMRWTPLAGLLVSAGPEVHNVSSQGDHRWRFVAGRGHRLFELESEEVVWSPSFSRLNQLLRRGRQGWSRKWSGKLVEDHRGGIYLLDASTVAAIGPDGRDRWRASPEGVRKLESPFPCGDGILFHGMSGLQRVAVRITQRGSVIRETSLGRGAVLIGAGPECEPLIWLREEIAMLDARGNPLWRHPSPKMPFVHRLERGFSIVSAHANGSTSLEILNYHGRVVQSNSLPLTGRLTDARILPRSDFGVDAIGLCLDVTSPCSRPEGTRGPFNALVTAKGMDGFRTMVRHVQGHLSFAPYPSGGFVVASSQNSETTDLTLRSAEHAVTWYVALPGRLSAGPYVGPSGEVYVATCRGWECSGPYMLIAVTGRAPLPE